MVQWYVFSSVAGTELLVATLEGLGFGCHIRFLRIAMAKFWEPWTVSPLFCSIHAVRGQGLVG